jgi:hypothetical protein
MKVFPDLGYPGLGFPEMTAGLAGGKSARDLMGSPGAGQAAMPPDRPDQTGLEKTAARPHRHACQSRPF